MEEKNPTNNSTPQPRTQILDREELLHSRQRFWRLKRAQDISFALVALILLSPVMLLCALLIFLDDPHGGPIFTQIRCGRDGKPFKMYKFRSMCVHAEDQLNDLLSENEMDGPVFKIKDDPRITRIGRLLRKTSLDELPQFFNILKGDMTIVGPRPPLPREVEQYDAYQRQRLYVTPGLTCYWQVQSKRNEIGFDEWVELDLRYIRERNFFIDWKIILQTVRAVFRKEGC